VYTGYVTSVLATTLSNVLCSGFNLATPTSTSYGLSSTTYTSTYTSTASDGVTTVTTAVISTSTTSTTYFLPTGAANIFNGGAYLYQKVQYGAFTYEIECYAGWSGGSSNVQADTFEGCIQQCNSLNAAAIGSCVAAIWQPNSPPATGGACYLSADGTQSPAYNSGQRLARLIYSSYPLVTDAIYLQPTTSNLGLCTTSASYAMQVIFPQFTDGTYVTGDGTGTQYYYENECGAYYNPSGGLGGMNGIALATLPPALQTPTSAEDCMRSCNYVNRNYQTGQAGSLTYQCLVYVWSVSQQTCGLYQLLDGTRITDPDKYSGKYIVAGNPQAEITDRPSGFGYKRRVLADPTGAIAFPTPAPHFDVHALISDRPANFGVEARNTIYRLG
jgi:hypothetical protein